MAWRRWFGWVLVVAFSCVVSAADDGVTVSKQVDRPYAFPWDPLNFTIVIANLSNSEIAAGWFEDDFPAELAGCSWTCAVTGSGWCELAAGTGDVSQLVWVPVGESATIDASCTFSPSPGGWCSTNVATFSTMDPDTFNQGSATTCNAALVVFADDFESGNTSRWSLTDH